MSKWTAYFVSIVLSSSLQAGAVEFIGTIPVVISSDELHWVAHAQKIVFIQNIRLSTAAQQVLKERLDETPNDYWDQGLENTNNSV